MLAFSLAAIAAFITMGIIWSRDGWLNLGIKISMFSIAIASAFFLFTAHNHIGLGPIPTLVFTIVTTIGGLFVASIWDRSNLLNLAFKGVYYGFSAWSAWMVISTAAILVAK